MPNLWNISRYSNRLWELWGHINLIRANVSEREDPEGTEFEMCVIPYQPPKLDSLSTGVDIAIMWGGILSHIFLGLEGWVLRSGNHGGKKRPSIYGLERGYPNSRPGELDVSKLRCYFVECKPPVPEGQDEEEQQLWASAREQLNNDPSVVASEYTHVDNQPGPPEYPIYRVIAIGEYVKFYRYNKKARKQRL